MLGSDDPKVAVVEETLHFAFSEDAATSVDIVVYGLPNYLKWRCLTEYIRARVG
jgi:hypothetical protein